ncbi:hypothetical protein Holit_01569 [Hollandina sp. SP2]
MITACNPWRTANESRFLLRSVYDVFAARIRASRSKDQGWQNVPAQRRGNGAQRNDLAGRNPEGPKALQPRFMGLYAYSPVMGSAPFMARIQYDVLYRPQENRFY